MVITEPFVRLMRWWLRSSEITFNFVYKMRYLNTQTNALPLLKTLKHTTAQLDEEVPKFPDDHTTNKEQIALLSVLDVSN